MIEISKAINSLDEIIPGLNDRILCGKLNQRLIDYSNKYDSLNFDERSKSKFLVYDNGFSIENCFGTVNYYSDDTVLIHIKEYDTFKNKISLKSKGKFINEMECSEILVHPPKVAERGWPNVNRIYSLNSRVSFDTSYIRSTFLMLRYLRDLDFEKYSLSKYNKLCRFLKTNSLKLKEMGKKEVISKEKVKELLKTVVMKR